MPVPALASLPPTSVIHPAISRAYLPGTRIVADGRPISWTVRAGAYRLAPSITMGVNILGVVGDDRGILGVAACQEKLEGSRTLLRAAFPARWMANSPRPRVAQ